MCFNIPKIIEFPVQEGDFSFVNSSFLRIALDHDYKYVFPQLLIEDVIIFNNYLNNDRNSFDQPKGNIWDSPGTPPGDKWNKLLYLAYQFHNSSTYKYSMKTMNYIRKFGWNKYYTNYQNNNLPFKLK